jgi:hypothetical protein
MPGNEGEEYRMRIPKHIMKVFFVNTTKTTVRFDAFYTQDWQDHLDVPPGYSCICLCSSSALGYPRRALCYLGVAFHAQSSQFKLQVTAGGGSTDFFVQIMISDRKTPATLYDLAKHVVRETGDSKHCESKYNQLKEEVPVAVADDICKDYVELRTDFWTRKTTWPNSKLWRCFCPCTLFWYERGGFFRQLSSTFTEKDIKRFHKTQYNWGNCALTK